MNMEATAAVGLMRQGATRKRRHRIAFPLSHVNPRYSLLPLNKLSYLYIGAAYNKQTALVQPKKHTTKLEIK